MSWFDDVVDTAEAVANRVTETANNVRRSVEDAAEDAVNAVDQAREDAEEFVKETGDNIGNWVNENAEKGWETVTETGEFLWSEAEAYWEDNEVLMGMAEGAGTLLWVLTHTSEVLFDGLFGGVGCLLVGDLFGIEVVSYSILEGLVNQDDETLRTHKVKIIPDDQRYVIFSDHHLFMNGSPLEKFNSLSNNQLYKDVLGYYGNQNYTLIENGDVEDLWMREVSIEGAVIDEIFDILGPAGASIKADREDGRIRSQANHIFNDNQLIYDTINEFFHTHGRYIRITGNHDDYWKENDYLALLQKQYSDLDIFEYVLISDADTGWTSTVVAHGHQLDVWNNPTCRAAGEAITEAISGIPAEATSVTSREEWGASFYGFDNILSTAIWDLVNEAELYEYVSENIPASRTPDIILGHTHTPRKNSLYRESWPGDNEDHFEEYTNIGTTGRWEQFIWCATIEDGQVCLIGWFYDQNGDLGHREFRANSYGDKLVPVFQETVDFKYEFTPGDAKDISKKSNWFVDNVGRYAMFRGVNLGSRSKLPPYLPILQPPSKLSGVKSLSDFSDQDIQSELDDVEVGLDQIKELGFNVVRLLVIWKAIEPARGNFEEKYLKYIGDVVKALYARDIFVLIDFHQDLAHEFYWGDGFPDWALNNQNANTKGKLPSVTEPNHTWQTEYATNKNVFFTFQEFWNDTNNVQTRLIETIQKTVDYFCKDSDINKAIIGYELFNEPPSMGIPPNVVPGGLPVIQSFETRFLMPYYSNAVRKIREKDNKSFIFIEPDVYWTLDEPRNIHTELDPSQIPDDHLVFAFHYYDGKTIRNGHAHLPDESFWNNEHKWDDEFNAMLSEPNATKTIPFLTEFGGSQDWQGDLFDYDPSSKWGNQIRFYMDRQYYQVEKHLLNATYWCYDLYNTRDKKDNWNMENFSLLGPRFSGRNLDVAARPFPLRASGKPTLLYFDITSKLCVLELSRIESDKPTVIYIPTDYHYPLFSAFATSKYLHWDNGKKLLYWKPNRNIQANQIVISRGRNAFDSSELPLDIRQRLSLHLQYKFVS